MSEPRSPYEVPFRSSQKVKREPWYLQPFWDLAIYFVFWPFWPVIVPLFVWARYLRKYWLDAWRDIVELWRMAYIEIPVEIFHFLKSLIKQKENDKTDHHQ